MLEEKLRLIRNPDVAAAKDGPSPSDLSTTASSIPAQSAFERAAFEGDLSRRTFLKAGAASGGGLLLSFVIPGFVRDAEGRTSKEFAPNAFIRIDRKGKVILVMPQVEMGQGTYTSMSQLIAEELEVDLSQITLEHAPPNDKLYANPLIGFQVTGGSTSVRAFWTPLRHAGAVGRTMLIAAAAKKWKVDPATCHAAHGKVIHGPTGRKLAHGALADRAAKLPVPEKVALKDPKDFTLIGTPAKRLDTPEKVNGTAKFGLDMRLRGMKIAAISICPVFGGKLAGVDDSKALKVKGVHQVVRLEDAVAVVADHMGAANKGTEALDIKWDSGPNAELTTADIVAELAAASKKPGAVARKDGDVEKAMAGAATKIEAVYQDPFLAHTTMEPLNCTVHVRRNRCDVWAGTQVMTRAQAAAAKETGLPLEKVRVHNFLLGGGFGRRLETDYVTRAVQVAKHVKGPVKVVWTREEDVQHDMYRPYYYDRFSAGLDADGMPVAWSHRITGSSILARFAPPAFKNGIDPDAVDGARNVPYTFPNMLVEYVRQEPPGVPTAFWRGVGPTHNTFVVESFIDELAAAAKKDPVEYRRALIKDPRARAVLDLVAEKSGWGSALPAGHGRGIAIQHAFGTYTAEVAEVEVDKDGKVHLKRVVCAVDCGHVVNPDTIEAQYQGGVMYGATAALYGEITIKNGRVEQSNFDDYLPIRMDEAPVVEVHIVKSGEAPGGVGEPGTATSFAAITNAVFAATGKRVRKLPLSTADLKST